jgi:hypothetical protein
MKPVDLLADLGITNLVDPANFGGVSLFGGLQHLEACFSIICSERRDERTATMEGFCCGR